MPWFEYKAARADGEVVQGRLEAADKQALARRLQAEGQIPIQIQEPVAAPAVAARRSFSLGPRRLTAKDIDYLTLELATLLRAGLPLDKALDTMARLADKPALKELIENLAREIRRGAALSEAMEQQGAAFDRFYLNMVRAGEATGALDMALERLAEFKGRARELRESILSSLLYPAILIVLAVVAVAVMLAFVVPRFTEMFAEAGRELPLLTQLVVGLGAFVEHWWWAILLAVAGLVYWLRQEWRDPVKREGWDARLLRAPLAGGLIAKIEAGRFTRTLGTLLKNGVSLLTAMDIAKEIVSNRVIARGLAQAAGRVRQGEGLARPLLEAAVLPPLTTQLLKVGEETGRLEHMLEQLADIYEREVRTDIQRLLTLAEPVIILVIAGLITVIILSVVLAVIETNDLAF
ncbi:MAG: ral secretion pathway protein [Pseudomonadota bacterium]|jgi:general secretion pathway protein F